jgi:hypothetical protein
MPPIWVAPRAATRKEASHARERRRPHRTEGERVAMDSSGVSQLPRPHSAPSMILYSGRGPRALAVSGGRRVKVLLFAPGRVCAAPGCETILSTYNPSSYCALHQRQEPATRRQPGQRPQHEQACPECGQRFATSNPRRRFCSDHCRMAAFQRRRKAALHLGDI